MEDVTPQIQIPDSENADFICPKDCKISQNDVVFLFNKFANLRTFNDLYVSLPSTSIGRPMTILFTLLCNAVSVISFIATKTFIPDIVLIGEANPALPKAKPIFFSP